MSILLLITIIAAFCYGVNTLSYHKGAASLQDHVMEYGLLGIIAFSFVTFLIHDLDVGYITSGAIGLMAIGRLWVRPFWSDIWEETYLISSDWQDYYKQILLAIVGTLAVYGVTIILTTTISIPFIVIAFLPGMYMIGCYFGLLHSYHKRRPSRKTIALMLGGYNALSFSVFMTLL